MKKMNVVLGLLLLMAAVYAKPLLLIIDASGSMDDDLASGKTKLEAAKEVAISTINGYNDQIALMVYTDCDSSGDPQSGSIRVWSDFTTDKASLTSQINSIVADGSTPIANAVSEGEAYVKSAKGSGQIVLLTDGEETCGGSVSSAIQSAQQSGIEVKVVGFALSNSSQASISTAVQQGGGKYYDAQDETGLQGALNQAVGGGTACCIPSFILALVPIGALYLRRTA